MSKLTPELQTNFLKLLELGVPIKYACEALNIGEATYFRWMDLGQRDKDRPDSKFREFRESVQSIPGKAMARKLAHLEKAADKGNTNAITWFLEHKYPELFGNKLQVEHIGKIDIEIFKKYLQDDTSRKTVADSKQTISDLSQKTDVRLSDNADGDKRQKPDTE